MDYNFEWDPAKAASNRSKHGISFEQAATIFRDPRQISVADDEHSDDEERWATIGFDSQGTLLVVIHTYREDSRNSVSIRIISARRATRQEAGQYAEFGQYTKMTEQFDFSKGERGKFYRQDAVLHIPIYLDPDVEQAIQAMAESTGQNMGALINDWLRNNIDLIHSVQPAPNS